MILRTAALLALAPAQAGALPRYDVERHCTEVAETVDGSAVIFNTCIDLEQAAYDGLKPLWPALPARLQAHCDEVARTFGGSYEILATCIDMETEAGNARSSFNY